MKVKLNPNGGLDLVPETDREAKYIVDKFLTGASGFCVHGEAMNVVLRLQGKEGKNG